MNRKLSIASAAILLALVLAAGAAGLYAYLQDKAERTNTFVVGTGTETVSEEFTPPEKLGMDNTFEKKVTVKNTGTSDQYVRVFLDFSDFSVRERSKIVYTKNETVKEAGWSEYLSDLPTGWVFVEETDPTDGAVLGGYFYYTSPLEPNASAAALMDGIKTKFGEGTDTDKITDFDVIVYSECVQTTETGTGAEYTAEGSWKTAWKSFLTRQ